MPRPSCVFRPPAAARACARSAYARRAVCPGGIMAAEVAGRQVLVLYDNELSGGSMRAREWVVDWFRQCLAEAGFRVLAMATYPSSGPDDGQTLAVVLDAGPGAEDTVTGAWQRALADTPYDPDGDADY